MPLYKESQRPSEVTWDDLNPRWNSVDRTQTRAVADQLITFHLHTAINKLLYWSFEESSVTGPAQRGQARSIGIMNVHYIQLEERSHQSLSIKLS